MGLIDSSLDKYVAHKVNMDICHAFFKRFLLQGFYKSIKLQVLSNFHFL